MSFVDDLNSITRDHVEQALTDIDAGNGAAGFGPSRDWDVAVGDKRYPPKLVLGTAAKYALGRELSANEISGGDGAYGANKFLKRLGYDITRKTDPTTAAAPGGGDELNFAELAARVLDGSALISHNMAILRAVVGGTEMALDPMIEFDPRRDFWYPPERRFLVAFLARRFPRWPQDEEVQQPLARFAVDLSRQLDALRKDGKISFTGVDYERGGGLATVFAPLREHFSTMAPMEDWSVIRRRHHTSPSAARSLLSFLDGVVRDGFRKHERPLRRLIQWWPVLGAETVEHFEQNQRFIWAYRHALMSNNAYASAGAQYFGPVIGNTSTTSMLEALRRWRDGEPTAAAPMLGIGKDDDDDSPTDRSHTNIAREVWGFLNLEKAPFYNNKVGAYDAYGDSPETAVMAIGKKTREWLEEHTDICAELSARFDRELALAARESGSPFAEARRWKVGRGGSAFDAALNDELVEAAKNRLGRLAAIDRAAILIHIALDSDIRPHAPVEDGAPVARDHDDSYTVVGGTKLSLRGADRAWIYSPGNRASHWDFDRTNEVASIGWRVEGDLSRFESKDELLTALTENRDSDTRPVQAAKSCWDFAKRIKVGDPIVARKGRGTVVGIGVVNRPYFWVEGEDFPSRVGVNWIWTGQHPLSDPKTLAMKTLVESSRRKNLLGEIEAVYREALAESGATDEPDAEDDVEIEPYTREDATSDLFIPDDDVDRMIQLLARRKNMIIQGPPGVGKTFVAKRIAYLLMEEQADDRLELVQFHQAYTYEQFVRGYRPTDDGGFKLEDGPLFRIAERARGDGDNAYVLIIDEINRGNLSKILGEGMMLLEADKRSADWGLRLAYSRQGLTEEVPFYLPENLFIIGTMNTADRSLAVVDYALRRRFVFVNLRPGFGEQRFDEHLDGLPAEALAKLKETVRELNRRILDDINLGSGFEIGHSYFCLSGLEGTPPWGDDPDAWLEDIYRYEIMPLLDEYWHDEPRRLEAARALLGISDR